MKPEFDEKVAQHVSVLVDRHLRRLLEGILLEVRTNRQYTQWLHEMLANHEMGKEAEIPTEKGLKAELKARKVAERNVMRGFLVNRANAGVGNGGMELTPEEKQRIAAGEDIEAVLGL